MTGIWFPRGISIPQAAIELLNWLINPITRFQSSKLYSQNTKGASERERDKLAPQITSLTLLGPAYLSVSKDQGGAHCAPPPKYLGAWWG